MRAQYNIGSRGVLRFIAGKSYYFGVGGGTRQFQDLIEKDAIFDVEIVWRNREGIFLNKQQLYIYIYNLFIYIVHLYSLTYM